MPAEAIIYFLPDWTELAYCPASSFSLENPSARWATARSGWPPPQQLAPPSPSSISSCGKTERRSIRGRGGRSQISKRRADEAVESESHLPRDWRCCGGRGDPGGATGASHPEPLGLRRRRRHLPAAQSFRRCVRQDTQRIRRKTG